MNKKSAGLSKDPGISYKNKTRRLPENHIEKIIIEIIFEQEKEPSQT